jgi:hypothetical protein
METIQLKIEKNQFIEMLQAMDKSDKLLIYKFLKQSLYGDMRHASTAKKTNELSMAEITGIVDEVRQEMYERGEQYI